MRIAIIGSGRPSDPVALDNQGSNNWALAPSRTTTGRAILASDPHRVHEQPSLRYITHLTAPGLNVIGAGEPAVPRRRDHHEQQLRRRHMFAIAVKFTGRHI